MRIHRADLLATVTEAITDPTGVIERLPASHRQGVAPDQMLLPERQALAVTESVLASLRRTLRGDDTPEVS